MVSLIISLFKRCRGVEFAASYPGSFERAKRYVFEPLGVKREVIRKGHPEDNVFVERSHQTCDYELYIPYLTTIKCEKDLLKKVHLVGVHL